MGNNGDSLGVFGIGWDYFPFNPELASTDPSKVRQIGCWRDRKRLLPISEGL